MEKGEMRCDANLSLRRHGGEWGNRIEIKNVMGIRLLEKAIECEVIRLAELLDRGESFSSQTR